MKNRKRFLLVASCICAATTLFAQTEKGDWAQFGRYAEANKRVEIPANVVFMGNSITENWVRFHPEFFKNNGYVGRGIGGQTSYQFLLRFREDVIQLRPKLVVINAGTNDIAENTGTYHEDYTFGNIVSMVELAQANHIKVILTSVLPATSFEWNPTIKEVASKIAKLNMRIAHYAQKHHILYVDYYTEMIWGDSKELNPAYTKDGVHPTLDGYIIMEKLIKNAIEQELNL